MSAVTYGRTRTGRTYHIVGRFQVGERRWSLCGREIQRPPRRTTRVRTLPQYCGECLLRAES